MTILEEIAAKRQSRLDAEGWGLGVEIPKERQVPLTPFLGKNGLICEVKRQSPSKGVINADLDPVKQGALYKESGAGNISVLTEEDYFGGSLQDLIDLKRAHPEVSVLRKDFLLHVEDVEVAYRCGADAFLLIAAMLESEQLEKLFLRGVELGMTPLVEVHNTAEIDRVAHLKPPVMGINCRDLKTFKLDRLMPLALRQKISWDCQVIYESGIFSAQEGRFFLSTGFSGLLVGEGVVRQSGLAAELAACFDEPVVESYGLWKKILARKKPGRPLVKVCGLTNRDDVQAAVKAGADMVGFILATSPRQTTADFIAGLGNLDDINPRKEPVVKIGVVVLDKGETLPQEIEALLKEGQLDGIQFHGKEEPSILDQYPGYKALKPQTVEDLDRVKDYGPQPAMVEAYRPGVTGGPGELMNEEILRACKAPLFLAGGMNPENIMKVLKENHPYIVDLSSGLEREKGLKDHDKIDKFFKEIEAYEFG